MVEKAAKQDLGEIVPLGRKLVEDLLGWNQLAFLERHVPELRFIHDDSAEQSDKISQLIDKALHADDHR